MKYYAKDQFNILHEDNHILLVEKPAGLLTQPTPGGHDPSVEALAKEYCKKKYAKENVFLHVVHRLDKQVSGIVLFAKTSKALSRLNEEMRGKKIVRHYLAMVEGDFPFEKGVLENDLIHASHKALVVDHNEKGAKRAVLHYHLLRSYETLDQSLLQITLETGRYHQIRAQLSHANHPIVGDTKYGSEKEGRKRIELHQYHLRFRHPVKKVELNCFLIPQKWIV